MAQASEVEEDRCLDATKTQSEPTACIIGFTHTPPRGRELLAGGEAAKTTRSDSLTASQTSARRLRLRATRMDRLLSPPSLTSTDSVLSVRTLPVSSAQTRCVRAKRAAQLQATWFFGLLFWIGVWDSTDLLFAYAEAHGLRNWLGYLYLLMSVVGALGLLLACCAYHNAAPNSRSPPRPASPYATPPDFVRHADSPTAASGHGPAVQGHSSLTRSLVGLLVLLSGLMLYVGVWDLIDYGLLELLPFCGEPSLAESRWCVSEAVVKLLIGAAGALGLLATGGLAAAADGFFGESDGVLRSQLSHV